MAHTFKPDERISRYRIIGPLGAGGMGEVYRARDESLERDLALKILPPRLVRDEERVRRFVLEARSASSLNHPNIITIYEIGLEESATAPVHFIAMELVTGETLSAKIHREKADLRTLLGWLAQAADGLAKAHAAGIVHRDLKPGNIMVSSDGFAKVLDFGLAKLTEPQGPSAASDIGLTGAPTETVERTGEGVVVGTTGYMSPEQVQGKPVDNRSDLFSFGCILYEAATCQRPFEAPTSVETMAKILREPPSPIEELNPHVPAELRRLIRRCLAKDPNQRLDSMKALAIELREIVEEYDSLSTSATSSSGASRRAATESRHEVASRRRWLFASAIGGAVVLAAAGLVTSFRMSHRGTERPGSDRSDSAQITTVTNRGNVREAALSPDGRLLAYTSGSPEGRGLWVRQLVTETEVEAVPRQRRAPHGLRFSPDGNYVFYIVSDTDNLRSSSGETTASLYEISSLGGVPRRRALDLESPLTFAPDGRRVCFVRGSVKGKHDTLVIMDLETGESRTLASIEAPRSFGEPAWSPDGSRIAVRESGPRLDWSDLAAYRVTDGAREALVVDPLAHIRSVIWLPDGSGLVAAGTPAESFGSQLWLLPYPSGARGRRITDDSANYDVQSISSDGQTLAGLRWSFLANLWVAEAAAGRHGVRQITFSSTFGMRGFGVAGDGSLLIEGPRDKKSHLWSMRTDGSGQKPIITGHGQSSSLLCLPGGDIVYDDTETNAGGARHIWRADAEGGGGRRLTAGPGERLLDATADGRNLLFRREGDPEGIWLLTSERADPVRLGTGGDAGFSPDGRRIGFASQENIEGQVRLRWMVIPVQGGEPMATSLLPLQAADVQWGPDSRSLTYLDEGDNASNVFKQRFEGGNPEPITHFTEGTIIDHRWSPDGSRLVLTHRVGDVHNLWTVVADGSDPVRITDFQTGRICGRTWLPRAGMQWTRDGRQVVFAYGQSGQDAILVRNFR